ncbi:group 1 glycosyl transferase [Haloarcula vallismortis ATCC 29715]|uniref:Group 1 glycosyl transferase n=1 Tax=Haloarcula vallismortis ATCC 29715 TaxID=662477 RepID=M0JJJ7_HALVA|nr:group 1 glycosyl transferase [Haloarcula vallismortis ATCC 29715]
MTEEFGHVPLDSRYYIQSSREFGVIWERLMLPNLIKNHDLDILFCPNGNAPMISTEIPVITWIHDVGAQKGWMDPIHRLYRNISLPRTVSVSDRIVTTSEFTKREIQEELKAPSDKIDIIYNGIDKFYLEASKGESIGIPEKYLLFVTSSMELGTRKNLDTVIEAFEILKQEHDTNHKLILVGGENEEIYNNTSVSRDDIKMMGYISKPNLKYMYSNADVFLFPSLHEGFGLPPLEAMACGTPIITSNVASMPEVLDGGGILIDPEDPLEMVEEIIKLQDTKYRRDILNGQQGIPERFTWESTKNRFISTVNKVIDDEIDSGSS